MMNWETTNDVVTSIAELLGIVAGGMGVMWGLLKWAAHKEFARAEDMIEIKEELEHRINGLDSKVGDLGASLENIKITLMHQPTMRDMEKFSDRLATIASEVGKIGATSAAQSDMLRSIDQRLIDKNR